VNRLHAPLNCIQSIVISCLLCSFFVFRLIPMLPKWSSPFSAYYTDVIHPKIKHIGRWHLSRFGMDSITTNQSESFNAVIKHLQQWQEAPIDAMALSLFRLTQFYLVEVQRGRRGLGNYSLREGLVAESPFEQVPCSVTAPASIVDTIRNGASSISLISDQDSCLPSTSSATNIEQTMTVDVPDATSSLATTDTGQRPVLQTSNRHRALTRLTTRLPF